MSHLKTKFYAEYSKLLSGEQPWTSSSTSSTSSSPSLTTKSKGKSPDGPRNRYFSDLLCLPVEFDTLKILIDEIKVGTLLDEEPDSKGSRIRENLNGLWRECLNVWRDRMKAVVKDRMSRNDQDEEVQEEQEVGELVQDDRRKNAIQTLLAISLPLLSKKNLSSLDLIHILAGSMNDSDEVFNLLVSCIDSGLKPLSLLKAAQLPKFASTFSSDSVSTLRSNSNLSNSNLTSNNDYFDSEEREEAELRHLVLRLSLVWVSAISHTSLSSYFLRKDLFLSSTSLLQSRYTARFSFEVSLFLGLLATLGGNSTSQISGVNNGLNNSPYARRIKDWVDEKSMEKLTFSMQVSLNRDYGAYIAVREDEVGGLASGLKWMTDWTGLTGKPTTIDPKQSGNGNEFSHLPPPTASILLPLYLLSRSNSAFIGVMLSSNSNPVTPNSPPSSTNLESSISTLPISFLTLISYLFTHSSTSNRSRAYSRISLLLLCSLILDEQGSKYLFDDSETSLKSLKEIKTCRQKIPILPFGSKKQRKRLITSALDSCTLFLRHNLSKKLDVGGYILTLKFIQKTIQLCPSLSVRLEYDWKELWSSLFALVNFLVARRKEMKINSDTNELIKTLITTLSISLVKSDDYLESLTGTRELIYEFLRNSSGLIKLMLGLDPNSSTSRAATQDEGADSNQNQSINSISTKLLVSLPSWKPISKLLNALQSKLDEWSSKNSNRTPTFNTVQKFISELDIETLFSGAEEDIFVGSPRTNGNSASNGSSYFGSRKREDDTWLDREEEKSLQEIVRVVSDDIRRLM